MNTLTWIRILILTMALLPTASLATTYYVTDDGSGSACTVGSPCAKATAESAASAGDTVYYNNADSWTASGGSQWLNARAGVTYDGETWGSGSKATVTVTGGYSEAVLSIRTDHPTYDTEIRGFKVNCNSKNTSGANINWPTSTTLTGATKRLKNLEIYGIVGSGSAKYGIKAGAVSADTLENIEIVGNYVHDLNTTGIAVYTGYYCSDCLIRYVVIQDNIVGPNINTGAFNGSGTGILINNTVKYAIIQGNVVRDAIKNNVLVATNNSYTPMCAESVWVRDNIVYDAESSNGIDVQCNYSKQGKNVVIERNYVYSNPKAGIDFNSNNSGANHIFYVIGNTLYNNGSSGYPEIKVTTAGSYSTLAVDNNAVFSNQGQLCLDVDAAGDVTSHNNNIYYRSSGNLVANGGSTYTAASLSSWESTGISSTPNFKNTSSLPTAFTDGAADPDGLSVESGAAINAGKWYVTTTSAGSGTVIPVSNARYFTDGVGVITGDTIQLQGQVQTATILNVNYSGNTLTVDTNLSWGNGVGVARPYTSTALNVGAYQGVEGSPTPPATDPTVTINDPTNAATWSTTATSDTFGGNATSTDSTIASMSAACSTCTPSSISITADDASFDSASEAWTSESVTFGTGTNTIVVTATEADAATGTDTITVYKGAENVIEAEDCSLNSPMVSTADAAASGGYYVSVPAGAPLIFTDGDGVEYPWAPTTNPGNWDSFTGTPTSESSIVKAGSLSMKCTGTQQYMTKDLDTYTEAWADFWFYFDNNGTATIFQFRDSNDTAKLVITVESDDDIVLEDDSTSWDTGQNAPGVAGWWHMFLHVAYGVGGSETLHFAMNQTDTWDSWDYENTSATITGIDASLVRYGAVWVNEGSIAWYWDKFRFYGGSSTMPNDWTSSDPATGTATCTVPIATAGDYKFLARVNAPSNYSNAFTYTVDGGDSITWDINQEETGDLWGEWFIDELTKVGTGSYSSPEEDPHVETLSEGNATVVISGLDAGTLLDYINVEFLPNPNTDPEGTITGPTTGESATQISSSTITGTATDSGSIAGGTYAVICNGSSFEDGNLTADDGTWDESSESWTLNLVGLPQGQCTVSVSFTDDSANTSATSTLNLSIVAGGHGGGAGNR